MPGLIVGAVPAHETGSAISFNQVLRYVGYSTGSALSGAVLQAHTPAGHTLPTGDAYGAAALIGCAVWAVVGAATIVLPRRGSAVAAGPSGRPAGPDAAGAAFTGERPRTGVRATVGEGDGVREEGAPA
jgi:hypothetical protein